MVSINYSSREVCCKIVYYGPGLSGKTTNLQYVHSKVPGNTRGDLISLATEADRTLYFDFLPINIGTINGFAAKFQLYTVPGQVYYNATRKLVLRGVDGVVFVADSQPDKLDENIESYMNLQENLQEYGYDIDELPLVIQYNKRDLPGVMPVEELRAKVNPKGRADFGASATVGNGVFDTLKMIIKLVLDKAKAAGNTEMPSVNQSAEASEVDREPIAPVRPYPTTEPVEAAAVMATPDTTSVGVPGAMTTTIAASAQPSTSAAAEAQPGVGVTEAPGMPSVDESGEPASRTFQEPESTQAEHDFKAAPAADDDESEPAGFRPFPGSREESSPRKITPTEFAPTPQESEGETTYEKNVLKSSDGGMNTGSSDLATPGMAPSLRRRAQQKKRGFFKRLFGIK